MLKRFGQFAGAMRAVTLRVQYAVLRRAVGNDRALSLTSEAVGRIPGILGLYTRQVFYKSALRNCGDDTHFGYQTLLSKTDAQIGERVYLGRFCTVGRVTIGDDTRIADGVQLLSGQHHHGSSQHGVDLAQVQHGSITIGKGVWIGANAVVMADVADGAIVGAGAVVTRPVAPGVTVAGAPAKPINQQTHPRQAA